MHFLCESKLGRSAVEASHSITTAFGENEYTS